MRRKIGVVIATAVVAFVCVGCGRAGGAGAGPADAPGVATALGGDAGTVTATEADNGRTLTLSVGDQLVVRLHSTYWQFAPPIAGSRLLSLGPAEVAASSATAGCVPGGGCGTVTATFRALAAGRETVAADCTSCGEALRCTGGEGTYRLYVIVR